MDERICEGSAEPSDEKKRNGSNRQNGRLVIKDNTSSKSMETAKRHEDPTRTTPRGKIRCASDYYAAAIAVDYTLEESALDPVLFLIGHSIELSLKAFLLFKKVELKELRCKYGHNLSALLEKAKELGLSEIVELTQEETESIIDYLNPLYLEKELQYIVTGVKEYPKLSLLGEAVRKLIESITLCVDFPLQGLLHVRVHYERSVRLPKSGNGAVVGYSDEEAKDKILQLLENEELDK